MNAMAQTQWADSLSLLSDGREMGVLGDPFLHLDVQPEAVDTQGDDGQKYPLDPVAEELRPGAVKLQAVAVDNGVLHFPPLHHADRPGKGQSQRDDRQQRGQQTPADLLQQGAVKF